MHSRRDGDDDDDDDDGSSGRFNPSQQRDMQTARGPNGSNPGQMAQNGGTKQTGEAGVYYGYYVPGHVQASHSFMSQLHMQSATAAQAPQNNYVSIPLHVLRQKMMQLQQETLQQEQKLECHFTKLKKLLRLFHRFAPNVNWEHDFLIEPNLS
jgi:hypothetical protein